MENGSAIIIVSNMEVSHAVQLDYSVFLKQFSEQAPIPSRFTVPPYVSLRPQGKQVPDTIESDRRIMIVIYCLIFYE